LALPVLDPHQANVVKSVTDETRKLSEELGERQFERKATRP